MVQEACQHELHVRERERYARAHPTHCPEWRVLEVGSLEIDLGTLEPLRKEFLRRVPVLGGPC